MTGYSATCSVPGCGATIVSGDSMLLPRLMFLEQWTRDENGRDFCKDHRPENAVEIVFLNVRGDG